MHTDVPLDKPWLMYAAGYAGTLTLHGRARFFLPPGEVDLVAERARLGSVLYMHVMTAVSLCRLTSTSISHVAFYFCVEELNKTERALKSSLSFLCFFPVVHGSCQLFFPGS